jgi:hypothetical protein
MTPRELSCRWELSSTRRCLEKANQPQHVLVLEKLRRFAFRALLLRSRLVIRRGMIKIRRKYCVGSDNYQRKRTRVSDFSVAPGMMVLASCDVVVARRK